MKNNYRLLSFLLLVTSLLFVGTGCEPDPPAPAAVNIRLEGAPTIINHYIPSTSYSGYVANMIFQTLGNFDPQSLELKPVLIREVPKVRQVTEGPYAGKQAFDFEIIDGAKWDNGSPVTGNDYLFTIKTIMVPQMPTERWKGYWQGINNIEVDPANPRKFTVYWNEFYMLTLETICQTPVLPAYNYDPGNRLQNVALTDLLDPAKAATLAENADLKAFAETFQQPRYLVEPAGISGSGPYRLESLDADRGAVLVKKEGWWGDDFAKQYPLLGAYPERLVYKVVKDDALLTNMLQNRELDIAVNLNATRFNELRQDSTLTRNYRFETMGDAIYTLWQLNVTNPKLQDVRVRRALTHIVDYDYIVTSVQQGMAERLSTPILPSTSYYAKDLKPFDYNIDEAKRLLAEAGWSDTDGNGLVDKVIDGTKTDLTLHVIGAQTRTSEQMLASLEQTARLAGIGISPDIMDLANIRQLTKEGKYETVIMGKAMAPTWIDLYQEWHSQSLAPNGDNRSRFADPLVDSLIVAVRTMPDEQKRKSLYHDLQKAMYDAVPSVFLYAPKQRAVIARNIDAVLTVNRPGYYENLFKAKE